MQQITLNLLNNSYESEYVSFMGYDVVSYILKLQEGLFLSGVPKSGKKHLVFAVAKLREVFVLEVDKMTDAEIVHAYDFYKGERRFVIFIGHMSHMSLDVSSRLKSLNYIFIRELQSSQLEKFLTMRMDRIGIQLMPHLLKYVCLHLNVSYSSIDAFIQFLEAERCVSKKSLKNYFES